MKIWIFGIGRRYRALKEELWKALGDDCLMGFIDNCATEDTDYEGCPLVKPCSLCEKEYDLIVVTSSLYYREIRDQLISFGILCEKIIYIEKYIARKMRGHLNTNDIDETPNKVLVITTEINLNGGTIAAANLVLSLKKYYDKVYLAAPGGNSLFITELKNKGIDIIISRSLFDLGEEDMYWIVKFRYVIVNVFQMISCAYVISKHLPTFWWIHENMRDGLYELYRSFFPEYDNSEWMNRISIIAVSGVAKKAFEVFYPNRVDCIIPVGISDEVKARDSHDGVITAIIGGTSHTKGQDVFVKAVDSLSERYKDNSEFWLIGGIGKDKYGAKISKWIKSKSYFRDMGRNDRTRMQQLMAQIDVVVCASREETLSISIIEGMMNSAVCVTTDRTGIADYIVDGESGYIVEADDENALCNCLQKIYADPKKRLLMGKNARKVYEENFTLDVLGEHFFNILSGCVK